MGYFDNKKNIDEYIKMAEGYDGRELIEILKKYLEKGSSILELGMGPGKDLEILNEIFNVTGSDNSQIFLDIYRKKNKETKLILLDAVEMNIDKKFDCIYSNKVLHHLTKDNLRKSLIKQSEVLNSNGLLFHSLWYGDKEEEFSGLRFIYYTEDTFSKLIGNEYKILEIKKYTEFEEDDSMYAILKNK